MQRGDGSRFDAQLDCRRQGMTDDAQRVRIILTDITERKQAERLLRENKERLRAIVDQVVVGIVGADLAGNISFVNNRFCDISGYRREELLELARIAYAFELHLTPQEMHNPDKY
jgi:PAS domain-containing protein